MFKDESKVKMGENNVTVDDAPCLDLCKGIVIVTFMP